MIVWYGLLLYTVCYLIILLRLAIDMGAAWLLWREDKKVHPMFRRQGSYWNTLLWVRELP